MNKIKIMFVFGTRPEAIKLAPVIKKFESNKNFIIKICVTGQHRDMLDQVLKAFEIKPNYDLNIMTKSQTLSYILTKSLTELEKIIREENPKLLFIHGDTSSSFAGALAAFYNKIKIAHIEAGLRTYKKYFPFPEEINRRLITNLADIFFAPTNNAKNNLMRENISPKKIFVTGNTVVDALKLSIKKNYIFKFNLLNKIDYKNKKIILVTAHRRENLGKPLENICNAILKLSEDKNLEIIYPIHANPIINKIANKILSNKKNIYLIPPLDVLDMHNLINKSYLVLTDSGGLQEEAAALHKPVLVLRNTTERQEGIKTGSLKLVGTNQKDIFNFSKDLTFNKKKYKIILDARNPFGDGNASQRILNIISSIFLKNT